ncbi:MAG: hypothetical protein JWM91_1042 [Rhodospirillales bacterium]|nr:hypothetical protein [Rhodospirillales bacterium]
MRRPLWHTIDHKYSVSLFDCDRNLELGALVNGSCLNGRIEELRGRSVLIATQSQLAAATALIELDGIARRLILCPPDLPADHISAVMAQADASAVVSDQETWQIGESDAELFTLRCAMIDRVAIQPARDEATQWVLLTSGTAGVPKMVVHTLSTLMGAIDSDATPNRDMVWATFYDVRRYGGLQVLLRTLAGGGSMVMSGTGQTPADFLAQAAARRVTHMSGTPSHWRRALMSPAARMCAPKYIRLSGEIADQPILDGIRAFFPNTPVAHAFASTEAGVAFEVGDGLAGFPANLLAHEDGTVRLRIEDGSLRIRSPRTALRYLANEEALCDKDGFVDTGDMVERRGDRCYFVGRRGGVINVGGLKVHPEEIEAVINRHPRIELSRVGSRKSPITGAIVVADIVIRPLPSDDGSPFEPDGLKTDIVEYCRGLLPPHKVPSAIRIVPSLEIAASGKLVRVIA